MAKMTPVNMSVAAVRRRWLELGCRNAGHARSR
jgi:hypothetical protein